MRITLKFILTLFLFSQSLFARKEPEFPSWAFFITSCYPDIIVETSSHHFGAIDKNFKLVIDTVWDKFGGTYSSLDEKYSAIYFKKNENSIHNDSCHGGWMLFNTKGVPLIKEKLYLPFDMKRFDGYYSRQFGCFQCENGKWGLCNNKFQIVQPPIYDHVWLLLPDTMTEYQQCWFLVKTNTKYGVVDTSGKMLIDTVYTNAYRPCDTWVVLANNHDTISFNGAYGVASPVIINPDFTTEYLMQKTKLNILLQYWMQYCSYDYLGDYVYMARREGYDDIMGGCKTPYVEAPLFQERIFTTDANYFSYGYGFLSENVLIKNPGAVFLQDASVIASDTNVHCLNYSIRGDACFPLTLDSLFLKSDSLKEELLHRIKYKDPRLFLNVDSLFLSDKFYISNEGVGVVFFLFENGRINFYAGFAEWSALSDIVDPSGPLRNRKWK